MRKPNKYNAFSIAGYLFIVGYYFPVLKQKFWMIDDHTFVGWYGYKSSSIVDRFLKFLSETNSGNLGNGTRFTPTVDIFYVFRTLFLPNNVLYWSLVNIFLISLTYFLLSLVLKDFLKSVNFSSKYMIHITILLITVLGLCNDATVRVYGRLGTAESLSIPFLLLTIRMLQKIVGNPNVKRIWIYLAISQTLLVFSKENYAWFSLATSIWLILLRNKFEKSVKKKISFFVLFSIAQLGIVILNLSGGVLGRNKDFYGNSTSVQAILGALGDLFQEKAVTLIVIFTFVQIVILILLKKHPSEVYVAVAPIAFLVIDQVFYRGNIQEHYLTNRFVALIWCISMWSKLIMSCSHFRKPLVAVLISILILLNLHFLPSSFERLKQHSQGTISFSNDLDKIVRSEVTFGQVAFVIQSAWDYEPVFSTLKQLRARGDVRPYFLFITNSFNKSDDPSLQTFRIWSDKGLGEGLYSPIDGYDRSKPVFCFYSEQILEKALGCDQNLAVRWLP